MGQETYRDIVNLVLTRTNNVLVGDVKTWVNDRIRQIADYRNWSWLKKEGVFSTVEKYVTGTADVTNASTTVSGNSTVWTSAMADRMFKVGSNRDYYLISSVASGTSMTIDAEYEESTATEAAYSIFKHRYELASDCAIIYRMWIPRTGFKLQHVPSESMNRTFAGRVTTGDPQWWFFHSTSAAAVEKVELYPLPTRVLTVRYEYRKRLTDLTADTDAIPQDLRVDAVVNGALATAYRQIAVIESNTSRAALASRQANEFEGLFRVSLNEMERKENFEGRSSRVKLARQYTNHRIARGQRVLGDWQPWTEDPY